MNKKSLASLAITCVDNTSLSGSETADDIRKLIDLSICEEPKTASVCIYSKWVSTAVAYLKDRGIRDSFKVATVANFPNGDADLEEVVAETTKAVEDGADEIDLVIDYKLLRKDKELGRAEIQKYVSRVSEIVKRETTRHVHLKTIIESGELQTEELIRIASVTALEAGSDFIKTSTGKVKVNATLEAAEIMLTCINETQKKYPDRQFGFKAAGGIKKYEDAEAYIKLANRFMPHVSSNNFRFGASSLLADLRATIRNAVENPSEPTTQATTTAAS